MGRFNANIALNQREPTWYTFSNVFCAKLYKALILSISATANSMFSTENS